MERTTSVHGPSLALLTDLYQLTMASGYFALDRAGDEAVFNLFFRKHPFAGEYTVAAGLEQAIDYLEALRFDADDLAYLSTLTGNDGQPLFTRAFLDHLGAMRFACDVDAAPEGTVVFPHEPLLRIRGPLIQCQLVETPLLNIINFSTLIATKAARICAAAQGEPVLEFGLRRAQGIDGALSASRAAYVGGCAATSNCLAGKRYGIPVKGTHAHSWVMSFSDELEAFDAYARALPNNCVFLVDTYDTVEGVRKAIEVGRALRARGHEMVGVRLDSGDLAELSKRARALLDAGGFPGASIVASNDLDEYEIKKLKERGATIAVWGVGTRLATAYDQPALGGVYKLAAIRQGGGAWAPKVKLSEQSIKVSNPGVQQVRRFTDAAGAPIADLIFEEGLGAGRVGARLDDPTRALVVPEDATATDLLTPVFRDGARVYEPPPLADVRDRAARELAAMRARLDTLEAPARYPVGLERRLAELKAELIARARADSSPASTKA
ncbi:MAG: nicotinate phosphoribosyltransferase [Myxococcales bacterium]|nr:nicotinate phosphoribosyltransferase [Myxococcales bacterium]